MPNATPTFDPDRSAFVPVRRQRRSASTAAPRPVETSVGRADARRLIHLVIEVLLGRSGLALLAGRSTPEALAALREWRVAWPDATWRVRSGRVQFPTPTGAEVAVHLGSGQRSVAVALRLDFHDTRWNCTAVQTGAGHTRQAA